MSGHSKWSTIKRQKEATDKERGKIFSKLARAITLAARSGEDPEMNFKLRLIIEKAKQVNMPKDNIERAIKKASGGEGGPGIEEVVYEGYGPAGIAIMVEVATDNKNRTAAEIKNIFERAGGTLAGPGAVSYLFKKTGLITVEKKEDIEQQILSLMDLGVDDVREETDAIEVYTKPENLRQVSDKIKEAGFVVKEVELHYQPANEADIDEEGKAAKVLRLMDTLEEHDDVQRIYSNFNIPEDVLKKVNA